MPGRSGHGSSSPSEPHTGATGYSHWLCSGKVPRLTIRPASRRKLRPNELKFPARPNGTPRAPDHVAHASHVTVNNVHVVTSASFGISLTHTTGVTIENSTISGQNSTTGRVDSAIDDVYGNSTGMVIKDNNIFYFRTAMHVSVGLVDGNYIHDPGYVAGDHTNGFYVNGGTAPLTIEDNTIFNSLGQTDAINLDAGSSGVPVANKTIKNNFLAGGSYTIYGGAALSNPTSKIVIEGNRIGQLYYPKSGRYAPVAYYDPAGTGNTWSGNTWDTTGQAIPKP